jgi:hypothetical protein
MALVKKDDEMKSMDKPGNEGAKQQVKEEKDIFTCPMPGPSSLIFIIYLLLTL